MSNQELQIPKGLLPTEHKQLVVALTGSLGSGKSSAAKFLEELGCKVFDADVTAREVVKAGSPGLKKVIDHFGSAYMAEDGTLDRKKLGHLVFTNADKRKELEQILHPLIRSEWLKNLDSTIKSLKSPGIIVYVVPLLFESPYTYPEIEKTILVNTPKEIRISRTVARDNTTRDEVLKRMAAQMPDEQKIKKANILIDNSKSLNDLKDNTKKIYNTLLLLLNKKQTLA